jgi:hypothetical protein
MFLFADPFWEHSLSQALVFILFSPANFFFLVMDYVNANSPVLYYFADWFLIRIHFHTINLWMHGRS